MGRKLCFEWATPITKFIIKDQVNLSNVTVVDFFLDASIIFKIVLLVFNLQHSALFLFFVVLDAVSQETGA